MDNTPRVTAGARIRFTVSGVVRACYQQGEVTLADGTRLSYNPDQHRPVVLLDGWRPGDMIETEHGRLDRTEHGGYPHWKHQRSGQIIHDDQVDPRRARVICWWGGLPDPTMPSPAEPAPLSSDATPAQIDAHLRSILTEDVYLTYQQAIGYAALSEVVGVAAQVRAAIDNDGLYNAQWREGWDDLFDRVDPDRDGPAPAALVTFPDELEDREPDVDGAGRTRESYYPTPKCANCGHGEHRNGGTGCPAFSAPATCGCSMYTPAPQH